MFQIKLSERAVELAKNYGINLIPERGTENSAGLDLKACIPYTMKLLPNEVAKIPLGVHIFLGTQKYFVLTEKSSQDSGDLTIQLAALLMPRSSSPGLKLENTIGLLDCDYQNELFAKYRNTCEFPVIIEPGERIVQLVVTPVVMNAFDYVDIFNVETSRKGGDGSTGK